MPYNWGAITALDTQEHFRCLVNLSREAIEAMPVVCVSREQARQLHQQWLFVHIAHYGQHVQLHPGEIGHFEKTRYVTHAAT